MGSPIKRHATPIDDSEPFVQVSIRIIASFTLGAVWILALGAVCGGGQ